jgi:hypothetical protein
MKEPRRDKKPPNPPGDGPPDPGIVKRGRPAAQPGFGAPRPPVADRCRDCEVISLTLSTSGGPTITDPGTAGRKTAYLTVKENEPALTIKANTRPADCPCVWSQVGIDYVEILTGAAARTKRRHFKFDQVIERVTVDPLTGRSPYITLANCTITFNIDALNKDLRAGINTGKPVFVQGVVVDLIVRVKCGRNDRVIIVNVTDA